MRAVSKKRKTENDIYREKRKTFLAKHPFCQVGRCGRKAAEVHHTHGRSHLLNDERYWKALCRGHHERTHYDPEWARSRGLLPPKGGWLSSAADDES